MKSTLCWSCNSPKTKMGDLYVCSAHMALLDLKKFCTTHMLYWGRGTTREVYLNKFSPDWVVKIPLDCGFFDFQYKEIDMAERGPFPAPRTHLEMWEGSVPIIHMEKVTQARGYWELPAWCRAVDCCQVGYTKDGKLVAYDLGQC